MTVTIPEQKAGAKKILLLCKRHYTGKDLISDKFGRLFHLPAQLSRNGFRVCVVAADYKNRTSEKKESAGVCFFSFPFPILGLVRFLKLFRQTVRQFSPDLIMASSDSHFGMLGRITAKQYRIPFVFDVYDDYRVFGTNRLPLMKTFFNRSVKKADLVVCASQPLRDKLVKANRNVIVIENGVDNQLFCPRPGPDCRKKLGIAADKTVIGYFGAIAKNRGVETLISAVQILRHRLPNVCLLIAGKNDLGLSFDRSYVDYRGTVDQKTVSLLINACDVAVIPYLPDPQVNMSNPCKLAEYLACEVPVVATRVSDLEQLLGNISEALCGPGDAEDLARAIRWQLKNRRTLPLPKKLTWEKLSDKLKAKLKNLPERTKPATA